MACGGEDGIDGVTFGPFKMVSFRMTVAFQMTDDRLDGVSSSQFALDCR